MRQHETEHLLDVMFATSIGDAIRQVERPASSQDEELVRPFPAGGSTS